MTVAELIAELQKMPGSSRVIAEVETQRRTKSGTWVGDTNERDVSGITDLGSRVVIQLES